MSSTQSQAFRPLVSSPTMTNSANIGSIVSRWRRKQISVPEFQRDSSQWDDEKKSLFIESIINGLTIPPIILYPEDDKEAGFEVQQVIDGQQRITAIMDFIEQKYHLAKDDDVEYSDNVGSLISGKKFTYPDRPQEADSLPPEISQLILDYTLNFVVLPKNLDLSLRLQIFRRINQAGVELSAQDLRLAQFSQCPRSYFIRTAGIFDPARPGSAKMISHAKTRFGIDFPWKDSAAWKGWWDETALSSGQKPSEMFLWYVVSRDVSRLVELIENAKQRERLRMRWDNTAVSALDLYCSQAEFDERNGSGESGTATMERLIAWHADFELWFNAVKTEKVPRISIQNSTRIAMFLSAAAEVWGSPDNVKPEHWSKIQTLLVGKFSDIKLTFHDDSYPQLKSTWAAHLRLISVTKLLCGKIRAMR